MKNKKLKTKQDIDFNEITMLLKSIKSKDEARNFAIMWQKHIGRAESIYWSDLYEAGILFELLAKKYNLKREFRENGII